MCSFSNLQGALLLLFLFYCFFLVSITLLYIFIYYILKQSYGCQSVAQTIKHLPAMQETWFDPKVGKIPWRRKWQPTPVSLPGKSQAKIWSKFGLRSLAGYSPWSGKELDVTEQLTHTKQSCRLSSPLVQKHHNSLFILPVSQCSTKFWFLAASIPFYRVYFGYHPPGQYYPQSCPRLILSSQSSLSFSK